MPFISKYKIPGVVLFFLLFLLVCGAPVYAVSQPSNAQAGPSVSMLERELEQTEALLVSFKNDSARAIILRIIGELEKQDLLDTPLGLRAQLDEAMALEQDENGEAAMAKLLPLASRCEKQALWDLSAKARLSLALLYEKVGDKEHSLESLRTAQHTIERHALDFIYPYFAIRMSSWQRIYGDRDSALYYARDALRTAPRFHLELEEAIGNLLMNMLLPKDAVAQRLEHSFAAVRLYQKLEDYTGASYMFGAIASIYYQEGDLPRALLYNDSTLLMSNMAVAAGNEMHPTIGGAYRFRGEILRGMGQWDSALANVNRGYQLELALKEQDIRDRIIEADAKFRDQLKQDQLDEQALELRLRKNQLRSTFIIAVLATLLALGFFIGLRRQYFSKQRMAVQYQLIEQQSDQLQKLNASRSRLFANISHELRTPLTLILGAMGSLQKGSRAVEQQSRLLKIATQAGRQLEMLITDILDLRKLEMGKMEVREQTTALKDFFSNHLALFESLARLRQLDYAFAVEAPSDQVVLLDRAKCRQIVNNLISNALKFSPAGGKVEARLHLEQDMLHLSVSDTGAGIHPDDLPHVFDRFYQSSRPEQPAEGGTGIGLALCKEYATLFGGDIAVESTLGVGTTFRVSFPVVQSSDPVLPMAIEKQQEPPKAAGTAASGKADQERPASTTDQTGADRPLILVVEDNPGLQEYLRMILSASYEVVVAENGRAALERLTGDGGWQTADGRRATGDGIVPSSANRLPSTVHRPPSLIVSDLMMPVMDGFQLLEALKAQEATWHIPTIMLTARADAADKLKALRIGVDDYLLKPFEEEELLARIANLLRNRAQRQEAETDGDADEILLPSVDDEATAASAPDRQWLEAFEDFARQRLADTTLTVPLLAAAFSLSESSLLRQLKRLTGLTPNAYLQEMRLQEARRLLESGLALSVGEAANRVGYADLRSFSRLFKNRFGKLPSAYLKKE